MESSLRLGPSGPANIAITTPFINVRLTLAVCTISTCVSETDVYRLSAVSVAETQTGGGARSKVHARFVSRACLCVCLGWEVFGVAGGWGNCDARGSETEKETKACQLLSVVRRPW